MFFASSWRDLQSGQAGRTRISYMRRAPTRQADRAGGGRSGCGKANGVISPVSWWVLVLSILMLLCIAGTFALSIWLGRFADAQAAGRPLVPWVSDTFELDPESGVASVILGPCSSALVFVFYLWHVRCRSAAALSCAQTRAHLSWSGVAVALNAVSCLFLHGALGFKIYSTSHEGIAHFLCAVGFFASALAATLAATVVEYRGDLASFAITAVRCILFSVILGCNAMSVVAFFLWDCGRSNITQFAGRVTSGETGSCLANVAKLTDPCLEDVINGPAICIVAPACEIGACLGLLLWYATREFLRAVCVCIAPHRNEHTHTHTLTHTRTHTHTHTLAHIH